MLKQESWLGASSNVNVFYSIWIQIRPAIVIFRKPQSDAFIRLQIFLALVQMIFLNRFICKLYNKIIFTRHSYLLQASEWCFRRTPNVESCLKIWYNFGRYMPKVISFTFENKFSLLYIPIHQNNFKRSLFDNFYFKDYGDHLKNWLQQLIYWF